MPQYDEPFSYRLGHTVKIASGATNTQIARMPWQSPVAKPGIVRKIVATNPVGTGGIIAIWDQDLSNTTPPTAGSAGDALLILELTASGASGVASATKLYDEDSLPSIQFVAGLAATSTQPGAKITVEVEYI